MPRSLELPIPRRLVEAALTAAVLSSTYFAVGHWSGAGRAPLEHMLDDRLPFVPESVWFYLPGYWACFLIPVFVLRDARRFRAALISLTMVTVLAAPLFVLFPIAAPRPPAPTDATMTAAMVRWLYANDPSGNTFPSLHVANSTLCAVVTTAAHRRWGAVVCALAAGVCASVLLLKQHWIVDIPAAWALAAVGAAIWRIQLGGAAALVPLPGRVPARLYRRTLEAPVLLDRVRAIRRRSRP